MAANAVNRQPQGVSAPVGWSVVGFWFIFACLFWWSSELYHRLTTYRKSEFQNAQRPDAHKTALTWAGGIFFTAFWVTLALYLLFSILPFDSFRMWVGAEVLFFWLYVKVTLDFLGYDD